MKIKLLTIAAIVVLGCCGAALGAGESVTIDSIDGAVITAGNDSLVYTDSMITFFIRITSPDFSIEGLTNGFRIYSPSGAQWDTTYGDTVEGGPINDDRFDLTIGDSTFSGTGSGADTVGFRAVRMFGSGMPAGTDAVSHYVTIGPIDAQYDGGTICIDSSFFPPTNVWLWAGPVAQGDFTPAWSGPHCFQISTDGTDVNTRAADGLPTEWMMSQNYPNPFNPVTQIAFDVPSRAHVTLNVFNVLGQQVATLVDQELARGSYTADWDGTSGSGGEVASGVYFYRLETDSYIDTKKMVLMK